VGFCSLIGLKQKRIDGGPSVNSQRTIKSKEFLKDVSNGLTPQDLMRKYGLSAKEFRCVLQALIAAAPGRKPAPAASRDLRRFPRKAIGYPLFAYDGIDQLESGRILDISERGVRIQGIFAKIGEARSFIVRFGPGVRKLPFVFDAVCRWVDSGSKLGGSPVAGFAITQISSLDEKTLRDILA
jgi:hypothetical protein